MEKTCFFIGMISLLVFVAVLFVIDYFLPLKTSKSNSPTPIISPTPTVQWQFAPPTPAPLSL
jgi:hypothetical protein